MTTTASEASAATPERARRPSGDATFGILLRRYRTAAGLSQEALAEAAGLSARAVRALEGGERRAPHRDTVQLLAQALHMGGSERAYLEAAVAPQRRRRSPAAPGSGPASTSTGVAPTTDAAVLPGALPVSLTTFVGRQREVGAVERALRYGDSRLLTLIGAGGSGKTRLALAVAARLIEDTSERPSARRRGTAFPDGVFFVPLQSLVDPSLVPSAIAGAVGVKPGSAPLEQLQSALRDKALLLVLDNVEHLLAAAPAVAALLAACLPLRILATSRAPLHIQAERLFPVPPLDLPDLQPAPPLPQLAANEAIQLLVERARRAVPDFALTPENARPIAEICHRLDGLPLTIELAAARLHVLPPDSLLAHLDRRLPLLTGGPRDAPARQRTLRDAIAWSYDLLPAGTQAVFRRLGVFVGGWTLDAAAAVCSVTSDIALDRVSALVDGSLVGPAARDPASPSNVGGGLPQGGLPQPRFRMLETIREYALERLGGSADAAGSPEATAAHARHAAYFLALAERAEPHLFGREQSAWLTRLETEHDNLRTALEWYEARAAAGDAPAMAAMEAALRLASALWRFWEVHGHWAEGRRRLARLVATARRWWPGTTGAQRSLGSGAALWARALSHAGYFPYLQGDQEAARPLLYEALAIARAAHEDAVAAFCLHALGASWVDRDAAAARRLYEESLAVYRRLGDGWGVARALNGLGYIPFLWAGDLGAARDLFEEGLAAARTAGEQRITAVLLASLGNLARAAGDHAEAHALLNQSLAMARAAGDQQVIVQSLTALGRLACDRRDVVAARVVYAEALEISRRVAAPRQTGYSLAGFACIATLERRPRRALRLAGALYALRETRGVLGSPGDRAAFERGLEPARAALGAAEQATAMTEGQEMSLGQAMTYALAEDDDSQLVGTGIPRRERSPGALTERQAEVLRLVAQGKTDRQIAIELVISDKTVGRHLDNVYAKLRVSSRAAAAAAAVRTGLV